MTRVTMLSILFAAPLAVLSATQASGISARNRKTLLPLHLKHANADDGAIRIVGASDVYIKDCTFEGCKFQSS